MKRLVLLVAALLAGACATQPVSYAPSVVATQSDEVEFAEIFGGLCGHVVKRYWPGLESWQVEMMAEVMPTT